MSLSLDLSPWLWPFPSNSLIWMATLSLQWPYGELFPFYNITGPPAAAAKSLQSCPTLCNPIDGCPTDSPVPGILQTRTLEWVAISFSNAWKWKVKGKSPSRVRLLATPWTAAHQAPSSVGFSGQEHWSGVPLPSPLVPLSIIQTSKILSFNMKKLKESKKHKGSGFWSYLGTLGPRAHRYCPTNWDNYTQVSKGVPPWQPITPISATHF